MGKNPTHSKKLKTAPATFDTIAQKPLDFDTFYAEHRDRLATAISLTLRDIDLGTEATDEAFVRACQRWDQIREYSNPQGWVYRVAMNWARSWLRRRRREIEKRPLLNFDKFFVDELLDVDLERALDTLSPQSRAVVVARFFMDWSIDETADALGVRPGTVKSRLNRALKQLQVRLDSQSGSKKVGKGANYGLR
ncbi:MAG: sigma-70 family RNA polymerase sigma factor [Acidimicrobiales bacterium]|nr:sigma-70 family RNA polymerase sigma factor [Acidimicrobiales bacterium]